MIKLENTEVMGWEAAIRGMRNPKNSWDKSDSGWNSSIPPIEIRKDVDWDEYAKKYISVDDDGEYSYDIGPNDQKLMMQLAAGGPIHAKYRRMITVYVDITAPLYWWKEFDTYKVGTVANSCSTMHKIAAKEFTSEDFSTEHLGYIMDFEECNIKPPVIDASPLWDNIITYGPKGIFEKNIEMLNKCRDLYLETNDKRYWWQLIQLLPSSYNQKRTVMMNYEVLTNIYQYRKGHKLDEWHEVCNWIESLPYSEIITGKEKIK